MSREKGSLLSRGDSTYKGPAVGREGMCWWLNEAVWSG